MNFVSQESNITPCYNPIYSASARRLSEQSYARKSLKMTGKNISAAEAVLWGAEKQTPKAGHV
jgi:hypothetical protein